MGLVFRPPPWGMRALLVLFIFPMIRLPSVLFSDVTARGPFAPSGFPLPLLLLRLLLRQLLSSPPPLRLPGTAALVTQAATFWLSSVVVSTQFGLTIKAVQCDNGREFDNNASCSFFLTVSSCASPAPTPPLRMARLSA
ncbi:hypothetical protein U9M48_041006 [Paspalum notatum var. saurae]|uniref:Uncharacterized protein n=1 Tax=Paspalum notatum var. saurae TaxID=547442 RepID=A0AAQ3URR2_PASNO